MTQAKGKTIRQSVTFDASPKQVYALLMDSKLHAAVTGEAANISTKVDGKAVAYGGYSEAKNRVLVPGQRIVQDWRASDWPEGHWSVAEWVFAPLGKGCKLTFVQREVPESEVEAIADGWVEYYWAKMKAYLAKQAKAAAKKKPAKKKAAKKKAKPKAKKR